jgi:hypothetical protein
MNLHDHVDSRCIPRRVGVLVVRNVNAIIDAKDAASNTTVIVSASRSQCSISKRSEGRQNSHYTSKEYSGKPKSFSFRHLQSLYDWHRKDQQSDIQEQI